LFDAWKKFLEHILQNGGALMVMISMVHHGSSWYNPSKIKQKHIQSVKNDHVMQSDVFIFWLEVTKYP